MTKAVSRTPGGTLTGPPKTPRGRRSIALTASTVNVLAPLVTRAASELLLTAERGGPIHEGYLRGRIWAPAVVRAQLRGLAKQPRLHDLRHSHVSWLIAAAVPLPVIQRRLGHESITTTIDTYGHLDRSEDAKAMLLLEGRLSPSADAELGAGQDASR